MPYQPIENHGIIGDMLIAALLDEKKGGYFRISPAKEEGACKLNLDVYKGN